MRFPNFRKASYPNGNAQSCFILMQNGMAEVVMGVQPNTTQERFWLADITKLTRNNMQGSAKDSQAQKGRGGCDDSAVSHVVKNLFHDDYEEGTQNLILRLAFKNPHPRKER